MDAILKAAYEEGALTFVNSGSRGVKNGIPRRTVSQEAVVGKTVMLLHSIVCYTPSLGIGSPLMGERAFVYTASEVAEDATKVAAQYNDLDRRATLAALRSMSDDAAQRHREKLVQHAAAYGASSDTIARVFADNGR